MDRMTARFFCVCCLTAVVAAGCAEEPPAPPVLTVIDDMRAVQQADEARRIAEARAKAANSVAPADPAEGMPDPSLPDDVPGQGTYVVKFETTVGSFTVSVDRSWAPLGAHRFYQLVKDGYYDEAGFFRVVPNFMVQWGIAADPADTAKWDINIMDDEVKQSNQRGYITFAKTGAPHSRSTQVFVNFKDNSFLDSQGFAPFGKVIEGMDVVDKISSAHGESPDQGTLTARGNAYLKSKFPQLDYIRTARLIEDDLASSADQSAAAEPEAATPETTAPEPEAPAADPKAADPEAAASATDN